MAVILIRHKVRDYDHWRSVFTAALDVRRGSGEQSFRLFHDKANPNDVVVLLEWDSPARAEEFVNSERLKEAMKEAGVVGKPEIIHLLEIRQMRRTAAD
jgi:heme-degrading monooxygenase HmoA